MSTWRTAVRRLRASAPVMAKSPNSGTAWLSWEDSNSQMRNQMEEGKGVATAHARQQLDRPYWPIGLCVAWVLGPDPTTAADLYANHRLGTELLPLDGWAEARTTLLHAASEF